jgi:hypothetical protein
MTISLNATESKTFQTIIEGELRCVINEWDSDICHRPSKKRIADGKYGQSIMDKWNKTQNIISGTAFINLNNIIACTLDLTKEEIKYSKNLLNKAATELRKELICTPAPYTGVYQMFDETATNAENIAARI